MNSELIWKFLKFGVVGFSGVFVDFGITWVCREKIRLNQYVANSTGFLAAVISNYILNRIWTFESSDPAVMMQFSKFLLASLIGLALNNSIIYLLNERYRLNFYLAKVVATAMVTLWNFWANYTFTFTG
ncbi:MAG: GtrA family protein [Bacteroidetes bacterium]|nr:MAG: GtrA family protein [Bacteroidota bacterium]